MELRWRLSHARGYLELGMVREAQAELDAIEPPGDEQHDVQALRLAVLHHTQDWKKMRRLAAKLVRENPATADWWVSLAFATRRAVSVEQAQEILRKAERVHPQEAVIQFNLGCYAAQLGALDQALERVQRAIEYNADFRELAKHDPDLAPLRARFPDFLR